MESISKMYHVRLNPKTVEHLKKIRENNGLGSLSAAIAWAIAMDRLAVLLTNSVSKIYRADGKMDVKVDTKMGHCEVGGCGETGEMAKGNFREYDRYSDTWLETPIYMCPKHLAEQPLKKEEV